MKKKISILGSTGSIGLSTIDIISKKKNYFTPYIFSANKNYDLICDQIKKFKPKFFIINDKITYEKVKKKFKKNKIIILNEFEQIRIPYKSDITVSSIPGIAGLFPTILMTKSSSKILIANKEAIICGWELINKVSKKNKTKIVPIDSEHYSISELLKNHKLSEINKIYITASGGPFFENKLHLKKKINPRDALKHPKWKMGKKITIDSSTLMNKILEFIEAQKIFNISNKKLDIIIHPESLVHAIIELKNGLFKFIYHETSMKIPLANAIFDKDLDIKKFIKIRKNNFKIHNLTFKKPISKIFPVIKLVKKCNQYASTSIIINACNEILVDQFLNKKIPFLSISKIIMSILKDSNYRKYAIKKPKNLSQIVKIDKWAREKTLEMIT